MSDNIQKEGMLPVGSLLAGGKYRIDWYLSSGGFGNTYVATNMAFNERVAIKELFIKGVCGRCTGSTDISISLSENQRAFPAHQEKFRKEARRLRKLSNPHIVKVHDLFDENATSYYVMDLVDGESLAARLKRTKTPLSETELMQILPQVLDALECVHNEGIWHLDLKPGNIMVDPQGNVQLIDFGASKQLKNANGESLSTSSVMAYTQGYAPSEQIEQNIDKFGPWTDLYALGATLYNLLTMQQPPSPSDIAEDAVGALKMPKNLSKKTKDLIFWMMKTSRKMRPQSVADVRQFLEEKEPEEAAPNTASDDGDTVLPGHGKPGGSNGKNKPPAPKPPKNTKPPVGGNVLKKIAIVAGTMAFLVVVIVLSVKSCDGTFGGAVDAVDTTAYVENQSVTVAVGPDNMRQYLYSGPVQGELPNGEGTARFAKYGSIPAATYEGQFVDGVCEDNSGNATLTFDSGEKYIGTFQNGYYQNGRYIYPDGMFFEGTFQDGNPYNGKWYKSDGSVDGTVVNGKEQ